MAVNPDLLIAAPMLQDYIVDKDTGTPLANGIISLYQDTARTIYKNWYYQTGSPGAYEYIALDNPLNLSSVGTIQDPHGNDVIPFFYPYDEEDENERQAYYITVYSSDDGVPDALQFTRENFPFVPSTPSPEPNVPTLRNYITNNVYWRNIGSLDCMDVTDQIIAPSQHDGYTNGDIRFIKNVTGANDDLAFLPMTETLTNNVTPEYYLDFECTGTQPGETVKCIQYPISLHVKTLANVLGTIVINAQNVDGNPNNFLDIYIYQFAGTGAISQPDPFLVGRITLNSVFETYTLSVIMPPEIAQANLGVGGDDALFLRVQYPLSETFHIAHTKPQFYIGTEIPDNDFDTYDQIAAITNSPRTGDIRTSLNAFQPYGWVPANDQSIGSASSSATCRANSDTWPLYSLIWNGVLNNWAPVSGGRGASAIADFSANKTLTLTRNLGRVLAGINPITTTPLTFTADNTTDILTVSSTTTLTTGSPVQVFNTGGALPTGLSANTVYFVINLSATTLKLAATIELAYAGTGVDFSTNGSGTNTIQSALGAYFGESNHTLTIAEMPAHNHTGSEIGAVGAGGSSNPTTSALGSNVGRTSTITDFTIASQGGGTGHNTIQPTTYLNVFMKL